MTRAGAVRAGFHDGGQAGLAYDPPSLAAGIHRCGCFQGSAGALAGEAAAPGIWRMHNRAGRRPGPGRQAKGPTVQQADCGDVAALTDPCRPSCPGRRAAGNWFSASFWDPVVRLTVAADRTTIVTVTEQEGTHDPDQHQVSDPAREDGRVAGANRLLRQGRQLRGRLLVLPVRPEPHQ